MSQIPILAAEAAAGYALYKVESAINSRIEQAVQNVVTAPFYGARAAYNYLQDRTNTQTRMAESKKRVRDYLANSSVPPPIIYQPRQRLEFIFIKIKNFHGQQLVFER